MLDYISKQLQARVKPTEATTDDSQQMNEAILEYAHLFQELDDLTMDGTEAGSSRPYTKIDIPIEDDIEIDSVELNLLDGRVTNIPMDATVQESQLEMGYCRLKTYDEFYQEAASSMSQFIRETDAQFEQRIANAASKAFDAYKEKMIQEGFFGFDKININDDRVPARITIDFGRFPGQESAYYVKLPVKFVVDKKHRILEKQLHSIQIFREMNGLGEQIRSIAFSSFGEKYGIEKEESLWDKVTPVELVVPVDPADMYCVAVGFEIDGEEKTQYIEWMRSIKNKEVKSMKLDQTEFKNATQKDVDASNAITKRKAIQEMAEMPARKIDRFFQEAIDFGDPDAAPATDAAAPDISVDAGMDTTASTDTPPTDNADGQEQPDANKEVVNTNDVSDQIAEKVADTTQAEANEADGDINIDDVNMDVTNDADVSDTDTTGTDMPTDEEIAADLGDDSSVTDDTAGDGELGDTSDIDVDNMTIDELLAQGSEKLKGMTIQQLKDFLASGEMDAAPTEEVAQEAFFITRGNVGKELDIHLRKTLGILNNNDMDIEELCAAFRKEGKALNRVVHKASKMKKVFDESEVKQLLRLNHVLSDLLAMMRADIDPGSVMTVKRLIQAFVSEATAVAKILERRNEKPVQEAAFEETELQSINTRKE